MPYSDAALIIAGHGSTLNADSSQPTYQQADSIRARGIFAEVHESFWKEEPNFHHVLRQVEASRVYIVPNFISAGYFTEQVLPREFGLTGPVTRSAEREIYYCEPVGLHPVMVDVLLRRAKQVVAESGESISDPRASACLFICGHGTNLNENSTKIIYQRVEDIRKLEQYADCQPVFMEQAPLIRDWQKLTDVRDVIVVPFFISDGLHSYEDIPVLLGLTENVKVAGWKNPHSLGERRLWYASAIGTEPLMADVILAQVKKFDETHGIISRVD
jgi:sirohydrochlorin cobaltochelatase